MMFIALCLSKLYDGTLRVAKAAHCTRKKTRFLLVVSSWSNNCFLSKSGRQSVFTSRESLLVISGNCAFKFAMPKKRLLQSLFMISLYFP